MRIVEVSADEYKEFFIRYPHVYNTVEFSELNRNKAKSLRYLLFENSKVRFGLVLGERDETLLSPFSAPFGGFTANKTQCFEFVDEAFSALKAYGGSINKRIVITLPPLFYDERQYSEHANALYRIGKMRSADVNYHFLISDFDDYDRSMERTAKNKLRQAMRENLVFRQVECGDKDGIARAYEVIRRNREEQGYPLRMSYNDVMKTIKVIKADFFLLEHNGNDVAAAQIFHVTDDICQVIYWGDLREYSSLRPMNYLAFRIFEHYRKHGIKILDIGPSTENSVPNYGLCAFKTGIGCRSSLKLSFEL
ncbi:MAG: GNAT family N-acetyltransferase [Prevotella sp.]|nr:GNAT family N-acetyltransferase [Prevotella sp.]